MQSPRRIAAYAFRVGEAIINKFQDLNFVDTSNCTWPACLGINTDDTGTALSDRNQISLPAQLLMVPTLSAGVLGLFSCDLSSEVYDLAQAQGLSDSKEISSDQIHARSTFRLAQLPTHKRARLIRIRATPGCPQV